MTLAAIPPCATFANDVTDVIDCFQRMTEAGDERWYVRHADRPNMFEIALVLDRSVSKSESVSGSVTNPNLNASTSTTTATQSATQIDPDNLAAKVRKWQREGFKRLDMSAMSAVQGDALTASPTCASTVSSALPSNAPSRTVRPDPHFMQSLAQARFGSKAAATGPLTRPAAGSAESIVAGVSVPTGQGGDLVPSLNTAFLFSAVAGDVLSDILENRRIMLIGHTGSGKTSLIEQIAARSQNGVLRANMNGQTTVGDFVGFWTVKGGETVWIDGVLPTAMRQGLWLIIDEIDFAEPAILAILTAVLEPGGRLMVKEKGNEVLTPHSAFRLFATANAAGTMSRYRHLYQGANLLNEAFLDRWRVYLIDYLSAAEESDVLVQTLPELTRPMADTLAAIASDCRAAFLREDISTTFSTRRLLDWTALMLRNGDPERAAGPVIYSKLNDDDAAVVRGIISHYITPAQ